IAGVFPTGIPTADMALVIQDMLTNAQYGVPCFPQSSIDTASLLSSGSQILLDESGNAVRDVSGNFAFAHASGGDASLQTYLRALGIGMCPFLDSQETAQSILDRWMQVCNCAAYWGTTSTGCAIKFVPYGDEVITGNGVTYVPNLTVVYDMDDDDWIGDATQDPVIVTRKDVWDAYNVVRLEVTSADGFFAFLPVEARDQNAIELTGGPRIMPTVTAHEIVGVEVGAIIAQLILQQGLYWRNTVTVKLDLTMCLLEPMDMITVTENTPGGMCKVLYRILSIDEDDNGELTVTAQEFRQGVSTAQLYSKQVTTSGVPNPSVAATPVNTPVILEPTPALLAAQQADVPQIWMAVCGGGGAFDPNWGGCTVNVSVDNDNYDEVGEINGPARMGVLTANLATYSGSQPDNTNTLYVDLSESQGVLSSGSLSDAQAGRTLCYVDGELISYVTATLTDATAANEPQTVPSVAPYQVVVDNQATFISAGLVQDSLGHHYTQVSSNPTLFQYQLIEPGVYLFGSCPVNPALEFTYTYANSYHYALTELERGMYGTPIGAHATGAQFARLDSAVFEFNLPDDYIGVPLYIKLVSFNIFGLGGENISDVSPIDYTPIGTGIPAGSVQSGKYTATTGDQTAGHMTIPTGLAAVAVFQAPILRAGAIVTGDAKESASGGNIVIADGTSNYTVMAGDVVNWLATGATALQALLDTSGHIVKDTSGNTVFVSGS
ncbi:MAG: phage tail protein, partial [Rhizomicrobium sp.]